MVASFLIPVHCGPENKLLNTTTHINPSIAYFLKVHRRQTRYARQPVKLEFSSVPDFGIRATVPLVIKGELIHRIWVVVTLPDIYSIQDATAARGPHFTWANDIGHVIISSVELEIGGVIVETLDGLALELIDELENTYEESHRISGLIGRTGSGFTETTRVTRPLVIGLPFWFTRHIQDSLPIEAMSVDVVRIHIIFRPAAQCFYTDSRVNGAIWPLLGSSLYVEDASGVPVEGIPGGTFNGRAVATMPTRLTLGETFVLAEYIFLDKPEAAMLRASELTYMVRRHVAVPTVPASALSQKIQIRIGGMLQDLRWVIQRTDVVTINSWMWFARDLDNARSEPLATASIKFKTLERSAADADFYRTIVPVMNFTKAAVYGRYVYAAAFAANCVAREITGAANMDKIVECEMEMKYKPALDGSIPPYQPRIYATTVSVLKIFGGRAGFLW